MRVPRAQKREAQTMADSRWCPAGFADTCRPWAGRTEARSAGKSFSAQLDLLAASGRARWRGACHAPYSHAQPHDVLVDLAHRYWSSSAAKAKRINRDIGIVSRASAHAQ
ncbi:unnamed protein product [Prorocentrum cordatum]|uniref:Uncharacterized protein n=1 Tax=Prorocentrum cordatum TaxID=2364126 RepID=A0ABN9TFB5_9DINO|nr:unnamed protein product [Polarella glacialis]